MDVNSPLTVFGSRGPLRGYCGVYWPSIGRLLAIIPDPGLDVSSDN
jgi:hypothetical protein